jgi:catechol 2,3-dioxygenase-like lactoylglutathione lyase family enzyme
MASEGTAGGMIDRIDHFVLKVRDIEASLRFYERALGLEREVFHDHGGVSRYALRFGRQKINLHDDDTVAHPKARVPMPGAGDFCLIASVPMEEVIARLARERIAIEEGPVARTGTLGPMRSIYFRDPDGNLVEVSEYAR